ncbi:MAG: hypothetical protein KDA24_11735 [Deltaproteobacteria bacterium]|nr:hypothetical protein [Deltaproteobacteria bacterium]
MLRLLLLLVALLAPSTAFGTVGVLLADGSTPADADFARVAGGTGNDESTLVAFPLPSTAPWVSTLTVEACTSERWPMDLATLAAAARASIASLAAEEAQSTVEDALRELPCSTTPVSREDLALLLEVLGEAAQVAGSEGNARITYEALLAVEPGYVLTSPAGTGYGELFNEVRRSFGSQATAPLTVWHSFSSASWNGEAVPAAAGAPLQVLPGRHLLQVQDGEELVGAWVLVPPEGAPAAVVSAPALPGLLAGGLANAGARNAIEALLTQWAADAGHDAIVVLPKAGAGAGYSVRDGAAVAWAAPAMAAEAATKPDRLRLTGGAGYANLQGDHYADLTLAADLQLIGPLHLRVEGDLAISQPISVGVGGFASEGRAALLPGLGVGVAVRPRKGVIQPFGALTVGAWFGALDAKAREDLDAFLAQASGAPTLSEQDLGKLQARHPVDFRGFLDGGVDLIPAGGPMVVRVSAGVGLGLGLGPDAPVGFQMRAGASAGVRFGLNRKAKAQ